MTARVLITGGAKGIGLAIAHRAVSRGSEVVLWDVDSVALGAALKALGQGATGQLVDISDTASVNDALAKAPPTHLVNNAGVMDKQMAFDAVLPEEVDRVLSVNIRGTLIVTSAFLRNRVPHPQAAIVNMSSIAGINGGAKGHAVYGATKGAMLALTAAMARDLAPDVRVNAIAPGIIDTDIQTMLFPDRAGLEQTVSGIPAGRLGQPDDVAEAAEWLLFGASYVTGEVIRVSGGRK